MNLNKRSETSFDCSGCRSARTAGLQIAVFVDEAGLPTSSAEADELAIFVKKSGCWTEVRKEKYVHGQELSASSARISVERLAAQIPDVEVVAGSSIAGIAYSVLDRLGKYIFEFGEISDAQFDGIAEEIALAEAKRKLDAEAFRNAVPAETEVPGVYLLDLIDIQQKFPELSSKMILKSFLKHTPFTELQIICRHTPPWLENEKAYLLSQKSVEDYLLISVIKKSSGK